MHQTSDYKWELETVFTMDFATLCPMASFGWLVIKVSIGLIWL